MISILEDINYQKSNFFEKITFDLYTFCGKREGHFKRERIEKWTSKLFLLLFVQSYIKTWAEYKNNSEILS